MSRLCLCLLPVLLLAQSATRQPVAPTVRIGEGVARQMALKIVMPAYPESSRRYGKTGVSVVEMVTQPDGSVKSAELLEAPDIDIGNAVVHAVRQWRLQPAVINHVKHGIQCKLTFYFRRGASGFFVTSPEVFTSGVSKQTR